MTQIPEIIVGTLQSARKYSLDKRVLLGEKVKNLENQPNPKFKEVKGTLIGIEYLYHEMAGSVLTWMIKSMI